MILNMQTFGPVQIDQGRHDCGQLVYGISRRAVDGGDLVDIPVQQVFKTLVAVSFGSVPGTKSIRQSQEIKAHIRIIRKIA